MSFVHKITPKAIIVVIEKKTYPKILTFNPVKVLQDLTPCKYLVLLNIFAVVVCYLQKHRSLYLKFFFSIPLNVVVNESYALYFIWMHFL